MRVLVIAFLLSACGQRVVYVGHVDPELEADLAALMDDAPDLIVRASGGGIRIESGTSALVAHYESTGEPVIGLCDNALITVAPADEAIVTSPGWSVRLRAEDVRIVLAHEIGHAMGLHHSETGLMHAGVAVECRGREAECLREALGGEHE